MINELISGIAQAIHEEFGNKYRIYKEDVKQGLKTPCFTIYSIDNQRNQELGNRYMSNNMYAVIYYPSSDEIKLEEINDVTERLYQCLEYIYPTGSSRSVRGTGMDGKEVDDVLHFLVSYDFHVRYGEPEPVKMQELEHHEQIKPE